MKYKPKKPLTDFLKRRAVARKKAASQKMATGIRENMADSAQQEAEAPEARTTQQIDEITRTAASQAGRKYYRWSRKNTAENVVRARRFMEYRKMRREDQNGANRSAPKAPESLPVPTDAPERAAPGEEIRRKDVPDSGNSGPEIAIPAESPNECAKSGIKARRIAEPRRTQRYSGRPLKRDQGKSPVSAHRPSDRNTAVTEKKTEAVCGRKAKTVPFLPRPENGSAGKVYYGQQNRTTKPAPLQGSWRQSTQSPAVAARNQKRIKKQVDRLLQRKRVYAVRKLHGRSVRGTQRGARAIAQGISLTLKAAFAAMKTLAALIGAAGGSFICVLAIVAAVAAIGASGFGLFFNDNSGSNYVGGMTLQSAIASINQEYIQGLNEIERQNQPYDSMAIYGSKPRWKDVLAVYAAKTTSDQGIEVTAMDEQRRELLAQVFWDMTSISSSMGKTSRTVKVQVDVIDEETGQPTGEQKTEYRTETTTILKITIMAKTADEMRSGLSEEAQGQLTELLSPEYDSLWNDLLGGLGGSVGALEGDAAIVATYLLEQGFTTEATAAILGNIKAECGWNYSTIGVLDGLYHPYERNIGIFQFTTLTSDPDSNDEYWRFMRWCEANGLYYGSLDAQLRWAFSGESGTSHWSTRWHERGRYYSNAPGFTEELYTNRDTTPDAFKVETNVAYATYSWMAYYEGCTNGTGSHLDRRLAYAYEYYDQLITTSTVRLIWPTDSTLEGVRSESYEQ